MLDTVAHMPVVSQRQVLGMVETVHVNCGGSAVGAHRLA